MAATITDAGNGTSTTSDTILKTSATISVVSGDWLVVVLAGSNDGTLGASPFASPAAQMEGSPVTSGVDRAAITYDPGAAGAGAALVIVTIAITDTRDRLVDALFVGTNTDQKAIQVYKVHPGAGETISFVAADTTGSTGNTATYSAATVSVTSGDIIFGAAAIETDDAVTGDTDTTNGSWSTVITRLADGGADASTMSSVSQYKTVTGTGDQAWAATTSTARDSARTYLVIRSAASGVDLSLTTTLAALTASSVYSVDTNTASLAKTLGTLTASAAYTVDTNNAALSKTLGAVTASAAFTVDSLLSLSKTLGALTSSSALTVESNFSLAKTLGTVTLSGVFDAVSTGVNYDLAKTLGALTASSAYTVDTNTASLAKTLGALTSSAVFTSGSTFDLARTLASATSAAVFSVDTNTAALAKTLSSSTLAAAYSVDTNTAALAKTLAPLTLVAAFSTGALVADVSTPRYQPILTVGRLLNR